MRGSANKIMDDNIEEEVLQEEEEQIEVEVDETDCKVENNKPKAASDSDFEEDSDDEEEIEALQASLRLDVVNRQPDGSASVRVKKINVIPFKN